MHRIDTPSATLDNKFTAGSPTGGVPATTVSDAWLNDVQEELVSILVAAGVAPVKGEQSQVLAAIKLAFGGNTEVFVTPGVTTWMVPDVLRLGMRKARVTVIGGGGGAGKSDTPGVGSGGGGGAGISYDLLDLTGVESVNVTVGAGGAGYSAAGAGAGANGGSSSFGAYCSATGGLGGAGNAVNSMSAGGAGGNGAGGYHNTSYGSADWSHGPEGGAGAGPGGQPSRADINGANATGPGGGGSGARATFSGGSGGPGIVIVEW